MAPLTTKPMTGRGGFNSEIIAPETLATRQRVAVVTISWEPYFNIVRGILTQTLGNERRTR
jgi:hypothetical protein